MADLANNTDAAEKAYAEASERVIAPTAKVEAPAKPAEPAPKAVAPVAKPSPAAKAKPKPAAKKTAAKRVVAKPAAVKTARKVVKASAKLARKAVAKSVSKSTATKPVVKTAAIKKDIKTMATTAKKTADDFTGKIQDAVKDAQGRAKTAFEKSQAAFGDAGEFNKGNLEAIVESGKILAQGLQAMTKSYVEEMRSAFSTVQADVKEMTSVKTPSEFVALQSTLLRKRFDHAVAYNSKNAEAALKLANDAFQPISNRVSLAVEKVRKAA